MASFMRGEFPEGQFPPPIRPQPQSGAFMRGDFPASDGQPQMPPLSLEEQLLNSRQFVPQRGSGIFQRTTPGNEGEAQGIGLGFDQQQPMSGPTVPQPVPGYDRVGVRRNERGEDEYGISTPDGRFTPIRGNPGTMAFKIDAAEVMRNWAMPIINEQSKPLAERKFGADERYRTKDLAQKAELKGISEGRLREAAIANKLHKEQILELKTQRQAYEIGEKLSKIPMPNDTPDWVKAAPPKEQLKYLQDRTKSERGLSSQIAPEEVVTAIIERRMPLPTGFALKSAYWQDVIARVAARDPNFDASLFPARAAARKTFASGPEARNVTAMNTMIGHLGTLDEAAQALGNNNLNAANAVFNRLATEIGDPRVKNFETARLAVSEEAVRVFRQTGSSESEQQQWAEVIKSSGSPQQLIGVIGTLGKLLESRIEAIGQQFDRTVTQSGNPAKVDPKNVKVLESLSLPARARSQLKEGVQTPFANGQVWTLTNGKSVRIK